MKRKKDRRARASFLLLRANDWQQQIQGMSRAMAEFYAHKEWDRQQAARREATQ